MVIGLKRIHCSGFPGVGRHSEFSLAVEVGTSGGEMVCSAEQNNVCLNARNFIVPALGM
jgi:hypothetical protein